MTSRAIVLGITGASGVVYATRLLEVLVAAGYHVHFSISRSAQLVLKHELGCVVDLDRFEPEQILPAGETAGRGQIHYYHHADLMAPIASGSFLTGGMIVCPCSGSTLGAIVHGSGDNLIHRAAQVHLKERRKLVLVPRETPLSIIQIDNLKRAAEAGAIVLPAMPGFYHGAQTIADLVDFVVARICDQLDIEHDLMRRWGS
jgi:flavin prenyltransferase